MGTRPTRKGQVFSYIEFKEKYVIVVIEKGHMNIKFSYSKILNYDQFFLSK